MRATKVAIYAFALLMMLSLAGCSRIWFFDFTGGASISDWHIDDWGGSYTRDDQGLKIDYLGFFTPFAFTGDFTLTVVFTLDTTSEETTDFEIGLYDNIGTAISDNIVNNHFNNIGNTAFEYIGVSELGPSIDPDWNYTVTEYVEIPGIIRDGRNTYTLAKTGDDIEIKINGAGIADFTMGFYESDRFVIMIGCDPSDDGVVCFETIKVQYNGNKIEI